MEVEVTHAKVGDSGLFVEPVNPAFACAVNLSSAPPFTTSARRLVESWTQNRRQDGPGRYTPAEEPEGTRVQRDATATIPRNDGRRRLTRETRAVSRRRRFVRRSWLGIEPILPLLRPRREGRPNGNLTTREAIESRRTPRVHLKNPDSHLGVPRETAGGSWTVPA